MARKQKLYLVREKLLGTADYEVVASSKAEALEKVRNSEAGDMVNSNVDHMGTGTVELLSDECDA